jgi:hypothetical protein
MVLKLLSLPTWFLGLITIVPSVAFTVLVAGWLRKRDFQPEDDGAVTALHATVSTIYTVLLAFVVVIVWQQLTDAGARVETEATRLSNILRDAQAFSATDEASIRDAVHGYIVAAANREWDRMAEGRGADPVTNTAYEQIWEASYRIEPSGPKQEIFHAEMITRLNELGAARRSRLLGSQASVPPVMWLLLLAGGVMVLILSYLLPHGSWKASNVALGATGAVISITLFLIFAMDHPYTGDLRVDPSPLVDLIPRAEQGRVGGVSDAATPSPG